MEEQLWESREKTWESGEKEAVAMDLMGLNFELEGWRSSQLWVSAPPYPPGIRDRAHKQSSQTVYVLACFFTLNSNVIIHHN